MPTLTLTPTRRLTGAALMTALAVAGLTAPAAAGDPPEWGYAVVRDATNDVGYTLAAKDRGNSTGLSVTAQRVAPGITHVSFNGLDFDGGGTALVTPLTDKPRRCSVGSWTTDGPLLLVEVYCHDKHGDLRSTPFSLNVLRLQMTIGQAAYLWADDEDDALYVPQRQDTTLPGAGDSTIARSSTGRYVASLEEHDQVGGHVQVSKQGPSNGDCKVTGWAPQGGEQQVEVACRDIDGDPDDGRYTLLYLRGMGLLGPDVGKTAYLRASKPKKASSQPTSGFRYSSEGGVATITRLGTGRYRVTLPDMPLGGSVQVTALGTSGKHCNASSIRKTGAPQRIGVRCFTAVGDPSDSKFTLAYAR